ncbi:uncharacterized protein LOC132624312 [Lycium barbarum]|uniref:uncharacterized protein LOC132624312 n=1 Tax=Lycium barbarum TaxID=112863 RepID=UPI00293E6013|nr:uncharacterized protein LOC132624312 [Lycium barbarum]
MADCRHLCEEVASMLNRRHLREYLSERARNHYERIEPTNSKNILDAPPHIINMIFGGSIITGTTFTVAKKMKISVMREKRFRELPDEDAITFSDEYTIGITLSHNDTLVITLSIEYFQVKRLLIDPGSSTNIIRWKVAEEMGMLGKTISAARTLAGFNMSSETTNGEIDLPVEAEGIIMEINLYVIDGEMQNQVDQGRATGTKKMLTIEEPKVGGAATNDK